MRKIAPILSLVFLSYGLLSSCSDKQDFGQYDDLEITPIFESGFLYIEAPESIINSAIVPDFVSQTVNFDAFDQPIFADKVLDGVITYEIGNTTSKPLLITLEFLDGSDNVLDTEIFEVDPAPMGILHREISYGNGGRSIDIITNTSSLRAGARNLGDNTSTSEEPDPKVIFKSSAKFRFRLK